MIKIEAEDRFEKVKKNRQKRGRHFYGQTNDYNSWKKLTISLEIKLLSQVQKKN